MRHRKPDPFEPQERFNGLSGADLDMLGRYNAERARGIMHAPGWQEKMAALQARFDEAERERFERRVAGGSADG